MVNEEVIVKKPFNYKKLFVWAFVLLILIAAGVYAYNYLFGKSRDIPINGVIVNPVAAVISRLEAGGGNYTRQEVINESILGFDEEYIKYVLYAMSVHKLHNPPLSSDTPKIECIVGEEKFNVEVRENVLYVNKGEISEEDIKIISSKEEVVEAMLAEDMKGFMSDSVNGRRTLIELEAGNTELLSKGYIQMYEEVTGESFF